MARNRKVARRDAGQGMSEYIIVVALVAIAAIGVVTMFGGNMRGIFGGATASLAGDTNVTVHTLTPTADQYGKKDLKTFGQHN